MVLQSVPVVKSLIAHTTTKNQSFMDMHYFLKAKGIKNNSFFLVLYDADLINVDPRDTNLPLIMKQKVARECLFNYWYFLREVVRIPIEGGDTSSGVPYKLHRGNLALNFLFVLNKNIFLELPRQHYKTISALCRYLWVFNFGTSNSRIMFINKKHDDSKSNLISMKRIRSALPSYLRMDEAFNREGKKIKVPNTAETLQHPTNFNKISTMPGARTKQLANGLGRGCTMPIHYYDEFAFIVYNKIIYGSAMPAFSTASKNAKRNNAPYGILITTTPGDLTTDEGLFAESIKNDATPFVEEYYDYSYEKIEELSEANTKSSFFYIRYTYMQLGSGQDYFKQMVKDLNHDWVTIRREIMLEWTKSATNCPFKQEDLDIIRTLCMSEPKRIILFGRVGQYQFKIWDDIDTRYPPIVGVDVSGGWQRDSSAITVVDSKSTKVTATFNCNYIPTHDLADLIYELVTQYMRNAVVNIERNGGFGTSVVQILMETKIKSNLYSEVKDKVIEERSNGYKLIKKTTKVRIYGTDSTSAIRSRLIEILFQRVMYHKDKFVSPELLSELETMEYKKNGKVEHADNAHDDQIFSYLMAMYVWYDGKDLPQYGIQRGTIATDADIDEPVFSIGEDYKDIGAEIESSEETSEMIEEQIEVLNSNRAVLHKDWIIQQYKDDQKALDKVLETKDGRRAYASKYNLDYEELEKEARGQIIDISDDIMTSFYSDDNMNKDTYNVGNLSSQFIDLDIR